MSEGEALFDSPIETGEYIHLLLHVDSALNEQYSLSLSQSIVSITQTQHSSPICLLFAATPKRHGILHYGDVVIFYNPDDQTSLACTAQCSLYGTSLELSSSRVAAWVIMPCDVDTQLGDPVYLHSSFYLQLESNPDRCLSAVPTTTSNPNSRTAPSTIRSTPWKASVSILNDSSIGPYIWSILSATTTTTPTEQFQSQLSPNQQHPLTYSSQHSSQNTKQQQQQQQQQRQLQHEQQHRSQSQQHTQRHSSDLADNTFFYHQQSPQPPPPQRQRPQQQQHHSYSNDIDFQASPIPPTHHSSTSRYQQQSSSPLPHQPQQPQQPPSQPQQQRLSLPSSSSSHLLEEYSNPQYKLLIEAKLAESIFHAFLGLESDLILQSSLVIDPREIPALLSPSVFSPPSVYGTNNTSFGNDTSLGPNSYDRSMFSPSNPNSFSSFPAAAATAHHPDHASLPIPSSPIPWTLFQCLPTLVIDSSPQQQYSLHYHHQSPYQHSGERENSPTTAALSLPIPRGFLAAVQRVLPLCSAFAFISSEIEIRSDSHQMGLYSHFFATALQTLVSKLRTSILRLEQSISFMLANATSQHDIRSYQQHYQQQLRQNLQLSSTATSSSSSSSSSLETESDQLFSFLPSLSTSPYQQHHHQQQPQHEQSSYSLFTLIEFLQHHIQPLIYKIVILLITTTPPDYSELMMQQIYTYSNNPSLVNTRLEFAEQQQQQQQRSFKSSYHSILPTRDIEQHVNQHNDRHTDQDDDDTALIGSFIISQPHDRLLKEVANNTVVSSQYPILSMNAQPTRLLRGGKLINHIFLAFSTESTPKLKQMFFDLLSFTTKPLFRDIMLWLYFGQIHPIIHSNNNNTLSTSFENQSIASFQQTPSVYTLSSTTPSIAPQTTINPFHHQPVINANQDIDFFLFPNPSISRRLLMTHPSLALSTWVCVHPLQLPLFLLPTLDIIVQIGVLRILQHEFSVVRRCLSLPTTFSISSWSSQIQQCSQFNSTSYLSSTQHQQHQQSSPPPQQQQPPPQKHNNKHSSLFTSLLYTSNRSSHLPVHPHHDGTNLSIQMYIQLWHAHKAHLDSRYSGFSPTFFRHIFPNSSALLTSHDMQDMLPLLDISSTKSSSPEHSSDSPDLFLTLVNADWTSLSSLERSMIDLPTTSAQSLHSGFHLRFTQDMAECTTQLQQLYLSTSLQLRHVLFSPGLLQLDLFFHALFDIGLLQNQTVFTSFISRAGSELSKSIEYISIPVINNAALAAKEASIQQVAASTGASSSTSNNSQQAKIVSNQHHHNNKQQLSRHVGLSPYTLPVFNPFNAIFSFRLNPDLITTSNDLVSHPSTNSPVQPTSHQSSHPSNVFTGFDALSLLAIAPFPLSLFLDVETLACYDSILQHGALLQHTMFAVQQVSQLVQHGQLHEICFAWYQTQTDSNDLLLHRHHRPQLESKLPVWTLPWRKLRFSQRLAWLEYVQEQVQQDLINAQFNQQVQHFRQNLHHEIDPSDPFNESNQAHLHEHSTGDDNYDPATPVDDDQEDETVQSYNPIHAYFKTLILFRQIEHCVSVLQDYFLHHVLFTNCTQMQHIFHKQAADAQYTSQCLANRLDFVTERFDLIESLHQQHNTRSSSPFPSVSSLSDALHFKTALSSLKTPISQAASSNNCPIPSLYHFSTLFHDLRSPTSAFHRVPPPVQHDSLFPHPPQVALQPYDALQSSPLHIADLVSLHKQMTLRCATDSWLLHDIIPSFIAKILTQSIVFLSRLEELLCEHDGTHFLKQTIQASSSSSSITPSINDSASPEQTTPAIFQDYVQQLTKEELLFAQSNDLRELFSSYEFNNLILEAYNHIHTARRDLLFQLIALYHQSTSPNQPHNIESSVSCPSALLLVCKRLRINELDHGIVLPDEL